jgi:hypothetical protein
VDPSVGVDPATPFEFLANTDWSLYPMTELYWPADNDAQITVSGYYSDPENTPYSIPTDQSPAEWAKYDYLYAPPVQMTYNNHKDNKLEFYHQEAQITINLSVSTDYPTASKPDIDNVRLEVYCYPVLTPVPTITGCSWPDASTPNLIIPYKDPNSSTFTLMLPPRSMHIGDKFLEVFNDNNSTHYTLTLPAAFNIESGHTYNVNAQIQQGGEVKIVGITDGAPLVNVPTDGGAWTGTVTNS